MKHSCLEKRIVSLEQIDVPDDWPNIRLAIVKALDRHPEAKSFLISKLNEARKRSDQPDTKTFVLKCLAGFPGARFDVIQYMTAAGVIE